MSDNDTIHDDIVSQAYQKLPADNPPSALDDAILAASRREVNSRPQSLFAKWKLPVSIAAVLTLSVSIVFTMHDQYGASLWKDDVELVSYDLTDSSDANFIESEPAIVIKAQEGIQEQAVVVLEDASSAVAAASIPATIVADTTSPTPISASTQKMTEEEVNDVDEFIATAPTALAETEISGSSLISQRQSRAITSNDVEVIKQKEQKLVAEISEMHTMQEELKREKLEITKELQLNESQRNEMTEKVAALTKKIELDKAIKATAKEKLKVKKINDPWLEKIQSLWKNDNRELARMELNRYLENKKIDKTELKGKLPRELLEIDN